MRKSSNRIFHYTTSEGLLAILESNCLHASNAFFLNDLSELTHMRDFFVDFIRARTSELWPTSNSKAFAEVFVKGMLSQMRAIVEPFVVCFCEVRNEAIYKDGLLSQWRAYGTKGGAAIEFKKSKLNSLISKNNSTNRVPHLMLGNVTYSKSAHLKKLKATAEGVALKPVTAIIQHAEKAVKEKKSDLSMDEAANTFLRMAKNDLNDLVVKMGIVSCYVKNHAFSEEREVRLLALAPPPEARNYRVRDGIFIPFVKIFESGRFTD